MGWSSNRAEGSEDRPEQRVGGRRAGFWTRDHEAGIFLQASRLGETTANAGYENPARLAPDFPTTRLSSFFLSFGSEHPGGLQDAEWRRQWTNDTAGRVLPRDAEQWDKRNRQRMELKEKIELKWKKVAPSS